MSAFDNHHDKDSSSEDSHHYQGGQNQMMDPHVTPGQISQRKIAHGARFDPRQRHQIQNQRQELPSFVSIKSCSKVGSSILRSSKQETPERHHRVGQSLTVVQQREDDSSQRFKIMHDANGKMIHIDPQAADPSALKVASLN